MSRIYTFAAMLLTAPAAAAPITTAGGTTQTGTLSVDPTARLLTFSASGANTVAVDGVGADVANAASFNFANAAVGAATAASGGTSYALTGGSGLEALDFGGLSGGPDAATFALTPAEAFVPDGATGTVIIRGTKSLVSDTAGGYDFGPAGRAFTFQLALTGAANFNTIFAAGGSTPGTSLAGSFSNVAAADSTTPPPAPVPEPATLAVFGCLAAGAVGVRRWKTRA